MWGTDSIWYGSPQPQIMAMRAFQITPEYQERYGYPALTDDMKGPSSGVTPPTSSVWTHGHPLRPGRRSLANISEAAELRADGALPSPWNPHGPTTRRQVLVARSSDDRWVPT